MAWMVLLLLYAEGSKSRLLRHHTDNPLLENSRSTGEDRVGEHGALSLGLSSARRFPFFWGQ